MQLCTTNKGIENGMMRNVLFCGGNCTRSTIIQNSLKYPVNILIYSIIDILLNGRATNNCHTYKNKIQVQYSNPVAYRY